MVGVCMRSPLCAVTSEPLLSWVYLRWILLFSLRYFTNAIPDWHLTRGLVRFYNFFSDLKYDKHYSTFTVPHLSCSLFPMSHLCNLVMHDYFFSSSFAIFHFLVNRYPKGNPHTSQSVSPSEFSNVQCGQILMPELTSPGPSLRAASSAAI